MPKCAYSHFFDLKAASILLNGRISRRPFLVVCALRLAIALQLTTALSAAAECACPPVPPPLEALKRSSTAFIGSVINLKKSPIKNGFTEVKFSLLKRIKGFEEIPGDTVIVFMPTAAEECSYPFSEGQDYVVFASGNPAGLKTTSCSGTNFLDVVPEKDREILLGR